MGELALVMFGDGGSLFVQHDAFPDLAVMTTHAEIREVVAGARELESAERRRRIVALETGIRTVLERVDAGVLELDDAAGQQAMDELLLYCALRLVEHGEAIPVVPQGSLLSIANGAGPLLSVRAGHHAA
jgi:hypothetical protein